jgi:hypothetical protein
MHGCARRLTGADSARDTPLLDALSARPMRLCHVQKQLHFQRFRSNRMVASRFKRRGDASIMLIAVAVLDQTKTTLSTLRVRKTTAHIDITTGSLANGGCLSSS